MISDIELNSHKEEGSALCGSFFSPRRNQPLYLRDVRGGKSSFVKKLEAAVEKARKQEEWRVEYMTLLMRDREKFAEGKAEGKAESDALWLAALTPPDKKG